MKTPLLPVSEIWRLMDYDRATGVLYWTPDAQATKRKAGAPVGTRRDASKRIAVFLKGRWYSRSKLVWAWNTGYWPTHKIFHLNGDPTDDRFENLRETPPCQTALMTRRKNAALPIGVVKTPAGKYRAVLFLGNYATPEEAHEAFKAAHVARHGSESPYA